MSNTMAIAAVLLSIAYGTVQAQEMVRIDPEIRYQVFEGFGEGTMDQFTPYYYKEYPSASQMDYLNKLYTLDDYGLGLTICRVLMPVGDAPDHSHMTRFYGQGGQCPPAFEPQDGVFDWNNPKHNEILWKIQGAAERGAVMWANWYSMPYWMTVSGCTAGHTDGSKNNLRVDREGRFVKHICKVLEHFRDEWDIEFAYLSPINEPEANWWVYGGGQPGTHVSAAQAIRLYEGLIAELPNFDLRSKLIAYDSAYTNTVSYLNTLLNSPIVGNLDVLSCHQYITSDSAMRQWAYLAGKHNKSLWQTEWGDWTNAQYPGRKPGGDPHLQMKNYAEKIHEALNVLNAAAWIIWEPEFLFNSQSKNFLPRKSYWAVAHYSRHVRPGMQRVKSSDSDSDLKTTAWVDTETGPAGRSLVIVTYNSGTEGRDTAYDLSGFGSVDVLDVRQSSASQNYQKLPVTVQAVDDIELTLPAESITTINARIRGCAPLQADINDDCIVDIYDLAYLAETWLTDGHSRGDITDMGIVNLEDVAVLAGEWKFFGAFSPLPQDGAVGINPDTILRWGDNIHAQSYEVYLGDTAEAVWNAEIRLSEYRGQTQQNRWKDHLQPNTTYYWRVDARDGSQALLRGPVWTFTTGDSTPETTLVGHWKMDETSGTMAADSSLYGHHGTVKGSPHWRPEQGVLGGAIELNGSGDAIEINNFSMTTDTATFVAWINGQRAGDWAGIVYSRPPEGSPACGIHFGGSRNLRYTWNDNDNATWGLDSGLEIPENEWVMTAAVIRPDKATLYVASAQGGLQSAINPLPNMQQTVNTLKIGWDSIGGSRYFRGLVDDVRIYSRALLPEEIAVLAGVVF